MTSVPKRILSAGLSLALTLLSWGPATVQALAAQRTSAPSITVVPGVAPVVNLPAVNLPAAQLPTLPSVSIPGVQNLAQPQLAVPQAQTPIEATLQRLTAESLIPQDAQAPAHAAKDGAAADFSRRIGENEAQAPVEAQVFNAATPVSVSNPATTLSPAKSGGAKAKKGAPAKPTAEPKERRSAFFPLAVAGVTGAVTALLAGIAAVVPAAAGVHDGGSVAHSILYAAAFGTAIFGGVFAVASVLDAAVFLAAMARGRKVTTAEFKRFLSAEVASGRVDAGVAALIRPHRPERTLRDLTFGYTQGGSIYLRPELAASPLLFRLVLMHELHHMRVGRERGPPKTFTGRLWRKLYSEIGARAGELKGPGSLGAIKIPRIERALRQTQLSLNFDGAYDVLVVNPTLEELKQPSLYRSLSGGRARVETIVTPAPQDYLGQEKNSRRFKAVVFDRPADLLPAAGTAEGKKLELALQQLDSLFILATRGAEREESGFTPGGAFSAKFRQLAKQSRGVDRRSRREVESFEKKIKDLWSQLASNRLTGLGVTSVVDRLYSGLQDKGLAFLTFSPTDPGVAQWERLLRYWEGPDGGRMRVARVDLEDGGHILVVRKLEARVGFWLKPRAGGRIEDSVPDADGSPERRAKAKVALEQAGFGPQLEEFAKLGVVVEQVLGAKDRRQEIFVTVPRRTAGAIRKYVAAQSISIEPSRADFEPHLIESGALHGVPEVWDAGVDGSGGKIMVIDTGGDATHEDFAGRLEQIDMVHDGHEDWVGHGTHVLGIATSKSSKYAGMSKGADGIIAKVFGRDAPGAADGPIMGAGSIARERGVDVVNLSFGSRGSSADNLAMFFSDLADDGVIVVASAGNAGPFDKSLSQPAAGEHVISVAAAAKSLDDGKPEISFYSSVGPDIDRRGSIPRVRLKPDLTAIGGDVTTRPDSPRTYEHGIGSAKSKDMPRRADDAEDGKHTYMSGTSMASPMAAGIANLVKQAMKKAGVVAEHVWNALPAAVRAIMQRTSTDLEVPLWYQGAGLISASAAVKLVFDAVKPGGEGFDWLDRLQAVKDAEDAAYKQAELAKSRATAHFDEQAHEDSETPMENAEAIGNAVYAAAAKGFAEGRAASVPKLVEALDRTKEPVWLVRFHAALGLLNLKSGDAAMALAEAALNDPDGRVRRMALHALAELNGRATDLLLQKAADDKRWDVAMYAAYALARRGDRSGVDRLHTESTSADKKARFTAVWLLGQLGAQSTTAEAEALAARLRDTAERGNIRHLSASALTNIGDAAPDAVSDRVILDLLDSAGPQNLALTRTISKFFPAALRYKKFGDRLRAEPLRGSVTGFILKHKSHVGKPGALGEMVQLFARYLDLPLDFPTAIPDPSGPGVAGVDEALGRLDLIIEPGSALSASSSVQRYWDWRLHEPAGADLALAGVKLDAPLLGRFEASLRAALPLSKALWVSVPEHKAYALTLELQRRGYVVRRSAALYPLSPQAAGEGGQVVDPASDAASALGTDLSLMRVETASGVSEARVLAALERVREAAGDGLSKPVIVQLGVGAAAARRESSAPVLTRLVDRLMLSNIGVVLPSGNEGPGERTLASPADAQLAVVVGAAGETTGLQYYSGRGAPGRSGVQWTELVDEVSPSALSLKAAEALTGALMDGKRGVGTGAAARLSARKLAELARLFSEKISGPDGRLPDGWFFQLTSLVKRTLQPLPSGAAHEVGGGLFNGVSETAELISREAENRDASAKFAAALISEARERLAPPAPKVQAKKSVGASLRAALKKVFTSKLVGMLAFWAVDQNGTVFNAPTNGPPSAPKPSAAWWSDPSQTNLAVTVPLYALRREKRDPGVGKFSDLGRYYRESLVPQGVDSVLLLPHFAVRGESPYAPVSLFALSEDQLDWSVVPEVAARPELLAKLSVPELPARQSVDYAALRSREAAVAAAAWEAFRKEYLEPRTARGRAFLDFRDKHAAWLGEYAEFSALSDILGKEPLSWSGEDAAKARRDPRFETLVAVREYAQWLAYAQLRAAVDEVHAAGGKLMFDVPMFRGKAGVDAWKRPGHFTDLATRNPGVKNGGINEDWKDLALWNWTALKKEGYAPILAPYEHWLDFGFDGARVDAFHFAYLFGNGQLASGDEPGDDFARALSAVFKARGAFPLAEAFEGKDADARKFGFVTVYGDWKKLSTHDDPRGGDFARRVVGQMLEPRPGQAARFVGYTLGDEWGDPFAVKAMKDGASQWRYRIPLPTDPDYARRVTADSRPRLAALKALLTGKLWSAPGALRSALESAASRFVKDGPNGPEIWAASSDWFLEEWGRDAFVSLPGLLLSTGRHAEARSVLRRFAKLEKGGLIPNRIPKDGEAEYNTIDGSLWFVQAIKSYVEATGDWGFAAEMRPVAARILAAYRSGTGYRRYGRFNKIYMDDDGLIVGPAQATWMDADPEGRDRPVTPRQGKAVEINALWYSSLRFLADASGRAGQVAAAKELNALADRVKTSFNDRFWFTTPDNKAAWGGAGGALRDVVDGDPHGQAIRPNMLLAVSRGGDLLSPSRRKAVVQAATRDLLTPFGLRTLSTRDSGYKSRYDTSKPPLEKDQAYHQGTAWPWLLGPYLDALAAVRRDQKWTEERIAAEARALAEPLTKMLVAGAEGSLPEVFDGGPVLPSLAQASLDDKAGLAAAMSAATASGQNPGGTRSQAWSVAELLRSLSARRLLP